MIARSLTAPSHIAPRRPVRSIGFDSQFTQFRCEAFRSLLFQVGSLLLYGGSLRFDVGSLLFQVGSLLFYDGSLRFKFDALALEFSVIKKFDVSEEPFAVGPEDDQFVWSVARQKRDPQSRTFEAVHVGDALEAGCAAQPPIEHPLFWLVDIEFFNTVLIVELKLLNRCAWQISRREHLKHDLGCNTRFVPLLVRSPIALGTAENDHGVGRA